MVRFNLEGFKQSVGSGQTISAQEYMCVLQERGVSLEELRRIGKVLSENRETITVCP